jgi:hypothetical protein
MIALYVSLNGTSLLVMVSRTSQRLAWSLQPCAESAARDLVFEPFGA